MAYSTITKKRCKQEGCSKYPTLGLGGWCWEHCPDNVKEKYKNKSDLARKNKNKRTALASKLRKIDAEPDKKLLDLWYFAKRHEMTGRCLECGASTQKDDDKYFKWSICHVVPKALVTSVATHPDNWLELCQDHHNEFDSNFGQAAMMKVFPEAVRKFQVFKDLIPPEEMRKVNPFLQS